MLINNLDLINTLRTLHLTAQYLQTKNSGMKVNYGL